MSELTECCDIALPKDKNSQVWTGKEKTFATKHGDIERLDYMKLEDGKWILVSTSGDEFSPLNCTHILKDDWAKLVYETKTDAPLVQELSDFIIRCKELAAKDNHENS